MSPLDEVFDGFVYCLPEPLPGFSWLRILRLLPEISLFSAEGLAYVRVTSGFEFWISPFVLPFLEDSVATAPASAGLVIFSVRVARELSLPVAWPGSRVRDARCVFCNSTPEAWSFPVLLPLPETKEFFTSLSPLPSSTLEPLASELPTIELPREFLGP